LPAPGFNAGIVDDPLSEQDKDSKIAKDRVWEWWGPGFYTRRQPEKNAIVIINTRWALDDLSGRLIEASRSGGDKWEIVNIPAILDGETATKIYQMAKAYPMKGARMMLPGESFSPRRWPTKEVLRSKANMLERDWRALYMGDPMEEEGQILKKKWWKLWKGKEPPECFFIFQTYDTAFEEHEKADKSAMTTWGVFEFKGREGRPVFNVILLGWWERRIESPDLPKVVEAYAHGSKHFGDEEKAVIELCEPNSGLKHITGYHPDRVLIENKASGITLIKELRRRKKPRTPVWPFTPPRGTSGKEQGKYARAQLGALVLEQGGVWYMDREWSSALIDKVAKLHFDGSDESDDLGDTVVMALIYMRQTYMIELESDVDEEAEAIAEAEQPTQRHRYGGR
jgi:hypothetical protein